MEEPHRRDESLKRLTLGLELEGRGASLLEAEPMFWREMRREEKVRGREVAC